MDHECVLQREGGTCFSLENLIYTSKICLKTQSICFFFYFIRDIYDTLSEEICITLNTAANAE